MWKKAERQSASAYFTWDITWTLCNACNPTFHWPVRCTPCSWQKKHPFLIDSKSFSEGRYIHVLAWYCVYRVTCVINFVCDKFWACLDMKQSSSGWKCKKVSTVLHHPPPLGVHLPIWSGSFEVSRRREKIRLYIIHFKLLFIWICPNRFMLPMGLDKGEYLSPYLFAAYLHDLSLELNYVKAGCYIGEALLNDLTFADDTCFAQVYVGCKVYYRCVSSLCWIARIYFQLQQNCLYDVWG